MLPDPGLASPLTSQWWLALVVLFIFTVMSGVVVLMVKGFLNRREEGENKQNERLTQLAEAIKAEELKRIQGENTQRERLHKVELAIMECQANHCAQAGQLVDQKTHHGDILRVEQKLEDMGDRLVGAITELHRRMDRYLEAKSSGESTT